MTIPNFISIARLLSVPAVVWALIAGDWTFAFTLFVLCGLSDAADGAIARYFHQQSALGAYLDPMADKALLVAVFTMLGLLGNLPAWLVIAIISRDILIVAAVLLSFVMGQPVAVRPLKISKATTFAQIVLAGLALAEPAFSLNVGPLLQFLVALTALLTGVSAAAYLVEWLRHMAAEAEADTGDGEK